MPPDKASNITERDCQSCGACCGPPYVAPTYIDLTEVDLARIPAAKQRRYVAPDTSALKTVQTEDGIICVALLGRIGVAVACEIYASRPGACRRFTPGSRACRRLRAYAGLDLTTG